MVKCESLRINMFRITHTGKSVNFPVTPDDLTSKKIFFSYLEGHKPGFLHADFVSSSNSKKPQRLERGATQRQRYQ